MENYLMIVDFSDINRFINLVDWFFEFYDNEWIKVLDDLNNVKEEYEDGNIKFFVDILEVQLKFLEVLVNC